MAADGSPRAQPTAGTGPGRTWVRELLGLPPGGGVRVAFAATAPVAGLRYLHPYGWYTRPAAVAGMADACRDPAARSAPMARLMPAPAVASTADPWPATAALSQRQPPADAPPRTVSGAARCRVSRTADEADSGQPGHTADHTATERPGRTTDNTNAGQLGGTADNAAAERPGHTAGHSGTGRPGHAADPRDPGARGHAADDDDAGRPAHAGDAARAAAGDGRAATSGRTPGEGTATARVAHLTDRQPSQDHAVGADHGQDPASVLGGDARGPAPGEDRMGWAVPGETAPTGPARATAPAPSAPSARGWIAPAEIAVPGTSAAWAEPEIATVGPREFTAVHEAGEPSPGRAEPETTTAPSPGRDLPEVPARRPAQAGPPVPAAFWERRGLGRWRGRVLR